jgi:hypothetical protein
MDATSRSNGKGNSQGSGVKVATEQYISWMEESCDKTPAAFFDK